MVMLACALALAACSTARVTSGNGADLNPTAPRWQSSASVVSGGAATWVIAPYPAGIVTSPDANLRPPWVLYRVAGATAAQVTPEGITTRGGLAVSAPGAGVAWLGIGSYRYQLYGAVAVTTDGGRTWSENALPAPFDPTPGGILGFSAARAVVLAGTGYSRRLLVTDNGGTAWKTLATASQLLGADTASCELEGLAAVGGRTIEVGTACTGTGRAFMARYGESGSFSLQTFVPPGAVDAKATVSVLPEKGEIAATWTGLSRPKVRSLMAGALVAGTGRSLEEDGSPLAVPAGSTLVQGGIAPGPAGEAAVLVGRAPADWLHPGHWELVVRASSDGGWREITPPASLAGIAYGLTWLSPAGGAGPPSGLAISGSTSSGRPAYWTVPAPIAAGQASGWHAVSLVAPKTATSENLQGAGS